MIVLNNMRRRRIIKTKLTIDRNFIYWNIIFGLGVAILFGYLLSLLEIGGSCS